VGRMATRKTAADATATGAGLLVLWRVRERGSVRPPPDAATRRRPAMAGRPAAAGPFVCPTAWVQGVWRAAIVGPSIVRVSQLLPERPAPIASAPGGHRGRDDWRCVFQWRIRSGSRPCNENCPPTVWIDPPCESLSAVLCFLALESAGVPTVSPRHRQSGTLSPPPLCLTIAGYLQRGARLRL